MHFLLTVAGVVCCVGGMTTDIDVDRRMTPSRAELLRRAYGLNVGDKVYCARETYVFNRFGGIDDGMPWIYGYRVQKNGGMEGRESRVCVWRRVLADGSLGERCPRGVERRLNAKLESV